MKWQDNPKWLVWFAPFRALSISAAYLVPFFMQHGLNQSGIFLLQSIFSLTVVLWEIPSGWLADRIGRARCMQISVPLAAVSMIAYGFSNHFWQFAVCEIILALANGFVSGVQDALLIDSLDASGRGHEYVAVSQRMNAFGFASIVAGLPLSLALVHFVGVSSTLIADGLLTGFGMPFVWRLAEPPLHLAEELHVSSAWQATRALFSNSEARWLVMLTVTLSTATYMGAWLTAPYYSSIGVPLAWFSILFAARSLFKAWLSHRVDVSKDQKRRLSLFVVLAGIPFVAMASGKAWLAIFVLGHDIVQALQSAPISRRLNDFMSSRYRATLNSVVSLQNRLVYAILGPLVGMLVDHLGLPHAALLLAVGFSSLSLVAFVRLASHGSLDQH